MGEQLVTKRLHISGLTPSLSPEDLERRLSSFGHVKAMDGFGARDALGDAKPFGFVTIETSAKRLEKCLNVLSGTTWKGAKLRIGEAKPDFQQRLAQINAQPLRPVRPKRTHAHNCGYPHPTLPLTPLSATVAASTPGWIVTPSGRVVRPMRMRPERPLEPIGTKITAPITRGISQMKKRVKPPPTRARRRLIDPTKWDSEYLKGVFLDVVPVPDAAGPEEEDGTSGAGVAGDTDVNMEETGPSVGSETCAQTAQSTPQTNLKTLFAPREEASFSLLDHLDLDLDLELGNDILGIGAPSGASQENHHLEHALPTPRAAPISATTSTTKVRSRLMLDPSRPLLFPPLDSLPYPYTYSNPTHTSHRHSIATCLFPSTTQARGLHPLPPSITFTRSPQDTPEFIRGRWEEDKDSLTHEWKKAWRDARGSKKRKTGAGGEIY